MNSAHSHPMSIKEHHIILIVILTLILLPLAYFFIKGKYAPISRPTALHAESLSDYDFSGDYAEPT